MRGKTRIFTLILTMVYMLSVTHSLYHNHLHHGTHEGCEHDTTAATVHSCASDCECVLSHSHSEQDNCCNNSQEYITPSNDKNITIAEISLQSFYDVVGIISSSSVVDSDSSVEKTLFSCDVEPVLAPYLPLYSPNAPPFSC